MIMILSVLGLMSLACLESAALAADLPPTVTATLAAPTEDPAGAVFEIGEESPGGVLYPCAVVVAEEALHLRGGAGVGYPVIGWLVRGERVRVIDQSDSDWWLVDVNGRTGYARARYLRLEER